MLPDIHSRIVNAKYIFERALAIHAESSEMSISIALLLTHDAIELLMLAVLDHVQAAPNKRREFMDFWKDMRQAGFTDPPDFIPMESLNKLRVGLKHNGNLPNPRSVQELLPRARGFFENVLHSYCGLRYADVSLVDRIPDLEVRDLLKGARIKFLSGDKAAALTDLKIAAHKIENPTGKVYPWLHAPPAPSLPTELKRAGWDAYLTKLHDFLRASASVTNALALNFDPVRYAAFKKFGPGILWSFAGTSQVTHWSAYEEVTIEIFDSHVEFFIEYALRLSESYQQAFVR